jgi:ADP-ribose pyrophosphatase
MLDEKVIRRDVVFRGKYLSAEVRTVRFHDGHEATREIVTPPDAVGILPVDSEGNVHLVRQFRSPLERVILEIPAGILEPGESAEETGRRECEEEVGVIPGRMERLCGYYHSVGFSTGKIELYLATDLSPSTLVHREHGEVLERIVMPFSRLLELVDAGEVVDSKTLVAVLWYRLKIK